MFLTLKLSVVDLNNIREMTLLESTYCKLPTGHRMSTWFLLYV